eukprot:390722-Pelagomonas_calceolata.AAC.1
MLDVLQQHFGIIVAIDAPGQGYSPPWNVQSQEEGSAAAIAEHVYQSILALGLQGGKAHTRSHSDERNI